MFELRLPLDVVHLCSAQDGKWPWLGGQAHRRGAYTRVCKGKVMNDYPHTQYDDSRLSLTDVSNFVVKVYHLCIVCKAASLDLVDTEGT